MENKWINRFVIISFLALGLNFQAASQGGNLVSAFSRSYTQEANGEYTKAIETLKSEYDESSYELNLRLGWLTYLSGQFTGSIAYYNKAIALRPLSIEARLGFALPSSALGNWSQIITRYNEVLKLDPNHYTVNYRMGSIYYGREDYAAAYKYFELIANLYPFDYDALIMLGWTNFKLGKLREARVLFQKALLNRPDDPSATEGLGLIH
ncbi:MAG: tetratricopeptide repeat protein [Lentimicrobium sp.]|jgi:tetratricopeptide (TPR) repeat protein|nr:tetratricopeptide repeat protein [Lentimicrobium sp.]